MAMSPLLRLFELLKARGLLASLTSGRNHATRKTADTVLPLECLLDSNRKHFSEGLSKLAQSTFTFCSPIGSPTSRGFCTVKRRRFNDLGEMKACLQSRCSRS